MSLTEILSLSLGAILVENFIFSKFLGICPFMGVSKKMDTAAGSLYRGFPCKNHGRTGNRTPKYLCTYHYHDYQQKVCVQRAEEPLCNRTG